MVSMIAVLISGKERTGISSVLSRQLLKNNVIALLPGLAAGQCGFMVLQGKGSDRLPFRTCRCLK